MSTLNHIAAVNTFAMGYLCISSCMKPTKAVSPWYHAATGLPGHTTGEGDGMGVGDGQGEFWIGLPGSGSTAQGKSKQASRVSESKDNN